MLYHVPGTRVGSKYWVDGMVLGTKYVVNKTWYSVQVLGSKVLTRLKYKVLDSKCLVPNIIGNHPIGKDRTLYRHLFI